MPDAIQLKEVLALRTGFDLDLTSTTDSSRRVLIIKFGQIGDVIMAIPAARALYEQGYEIHWACGQAVQPLLECYSWITVIPANDRAIFFGTPMARIKAIAQLWSRIAFRSYDLCATLYYDRRYGVLSWPVRARRTVSLSRRSRATTLITGRHPTDEYIRVCLQREDGCYEQSAAPVRPDRLPKSPWPPRSLPARVAIVPGVANNLLRQQVLSREPEALRRWPVERYVSLAARLLERGWEVMLIGGPAETWVKPYFQQLPVVDSIGTLSLPEVVSACDACDAVICNDTGPFHLAGLSDTCLIGIFGPTDPSTRVPRRPYTVGLWGGQGFACRPCYDGRDFAPCQFNGCMHQVTVEMVLRELDHLLQARSQGISAPWRIAYPGDGIEGARGG